MSEEDPVEELEKMAEKAAKKPRAKARAKPTKSKKKAAPATKKEAGAPKPPKPKRTIVRFGEAETIQVTI